MLMHVHQPATSTYRFRLCIIARIRPENNRHFLPYHDSRDQRQPLHPSSDLGKLTSFLLASISAGLDCLEGEDHNEG